MITLERFCYSKMGTFGILSSEEGFHCYTVELPWRSNEVGKSCVPEGIYKLEKRRSGVVERTSRGDYLEGWEVANVPNRTYIMIHIANTISDIDGCIGTGEDLGCLYGKWCISNSRKLFQSFMNHMNEYYPDGTDISIRSSGAPEYP